MVIDEWEMIPMPSMKVPTSLYASREQRPHKVDELAEREASLARKTKVVENMTTLVTREKVDGTEWNVGLSLYRIGLIHKLPKPAQSDVEMDDMSM